MPIAPITGRLRKGLWRDISVALGLGLGAGYAFWCVNSLFFFLSVSRETRYGYHLKEGMTTHMRMITPAHSL